MKSSRSFFYGIFLTTIILSQAVLNASVQEPSKCKIKNKSLRAVQYRIGNFERSKLSSDGSPVLGIDISVKPQQINADYLVLLARSMNQRFCKEDRLVVMIFDRYEIAVNFKPDNSFALDAWRGEYVLDRTTGEEWVRFSTVRDYQGNPEAQIKIDLKPSTSPCNDHK